MKTYVANSVWLSGVEDCYRANNNNAQFTIVVRAKNQKRVVELLGSNCSLSHLRNFYGIHEAGETHKGIPKEDEVIYYFVESTKNGYVGKWFEYKTTK